MIVRRLICIALSGSLVIGGCKPRRDSSLASNNTEQIKDNDYNGFITAIEKFKMDALSGGYVQTMLAEDRSKERSYKTKMSGLIELARAKKMPHIVKLATISRADTLNKLGDRGWEDGLAQAVAGMSDCSFPIPCMTMLAEFYTVGNIAPKLAIQALGQKSRLRSSVLNLDEPNLIKDTVKYKLDLMEAYALFISSYRYADKVTNYGVFTEQYYESNTRLVRAAIARLKDQYRTKLRQFTVTAEAFAEGIVSQYHNDNGQPLTLTDLDAETRLSILRESHIYRSELTQMYITVNSIEEQIKRRESADPFEYYKNFSVDNTLEGQGRFASLTMYSTFESSVPSRYEWRDAVKRNALILGEGYSSLAVTAENLVKSVENMMATFVSNDPYFKAVESGWNYTRYMMQKVERMYVYEDKYFQSIPYQIFKYKAEQQNLNSEVEKLRNKSDDELQRATALDNFKYAKMAVHERYMVLMCSFTKGFFLDSSNTIKSREYPNRSYIPPYECKAGSFSGKEGTWKYADQECRDHAYELSEANICGGENTSFRNLRRTISQNILALEKKKVWDPVITKGIILSATALSIVVTMGATSYLAIGAAASGAAVVPISLAARAGYFVVNAMIGAAIFTLTNNVILLSAGIKKYNGQFWPSLGKEFLIGFGMMLFLPLGAMAGEALAARATINITNEFFKEIAARGVMVATDTAFFIPMVPASITVMNYLDGKPGRTWKQLEDLSASEELLLATLFSLGLRMNFKASYYTKRYSFREEFKLATGRNPGNTKVNPSFVKPQTLPSASPTQ